MLLAYCPCWQGNLEQGVPASPLRSEPSLASPDRFYSGVADRLPDLEGRRRHRDVAHAERGEGVEDGVDDDGERRGAAAFAAGFDTKRVGRRQHLDNLGCEGR